MATSNTMFAALAVSGMMVITVMMSEPPAAPEDHDNYSESPTGYRTSNHVSRGGGSSAGGGGGRAAHQVDCRENGEAWGADGFRAGCRKAEGEATEEAEAEADERPLPGPFGMLYRAMSSAGGED